MIIGRFFISWVPENPTVLSTCFFKVRDRFETYMDKKALISHHFIRRTKEGGYVRDDDITFNHRKVTATSRKKTKTISPNIQDIISAVYYARTLSADTLKMAIISMLIFISMILCTFQQYSFRVERRLKPNLGYLIVLLSNLW